MTRPAVLLILVLLIAGGLRLSRLDIRPMHTDEAVHAIKFGALLEQGVYRYDRAEYHGPTLNYLTLVPAWLTGTRTLVEVDETTLRVVPAVAGLLLALLILVFEGRVSRASTLAALAAAVSPALVFYSRYYIQEMLLVLFSFTFLAFADRAVRSGRTRWAIASGAAAGLMYATKETSIITFGVALAAAVFTRLLTPGGRDRTVAALRGAVLPFIASALVIILLFFSSFGTYPGGIVDAFSGFDVYFTRAGDPGPHVHPWYYYLSVLFWTKGSGFLLWTEGVVLLLGLVGIGSAWNRRNSVTSDGHRFRLFLAIFTVLLFAVLSLIPYKTPWVILTPYAGLVIMAGIGADWLLEKARGMQFAAAGILLLGGTHLFYESVAASFRSCEAPENPYVYAQTVSDARELSRRITGLNSDHPGGLVVQTITPGHDYWPFPWYLRGISKTGWWGAMPDSLPAADVYIVSPGLEPALAASLYRSGVPGSQSLYVPLMEKPVSLRPGKEICAFVRYDLLAGHRAGEPR
jgi:uncharacterized protein (TIGR03663 family)